MSKKYLLIILGLSLLTHFAFFGQPAETVFDEVHFGKFVSGYFTGEYFFDIHPPLGKLLITATLKIRDFLPRSEPEALLPGSFETIGQRYQDDAYKWLRFLPSLAGALLPVVIFLIALEIGISQKFAFLAGLLLVFENALLVQSRFILLDSFLLLFGFLAILFFLKAKAYRLSPKFLILAGIFAALAASVKWTGLSFLGLIIIFYLLGSRNIKARASYLRQLKKAIIPLAVLPLLIYFSIFALHFSLLSKTGPGDAFHPPNFQEMNVFEKFTELNAEIYQSNARLNATHPYSSQWYEWPLMARSIFYWDGGLPAQAGDTKIYLLGNPLIWWLSALFVIYSLVNLPKFKNPAHYFLLFGFMANWLPFIFIGRVMFLYHYFTSLIFAILILAYSLDPSSRSSQDSLHYGASKSEFKHKKIAFNAILAGSIILFLFFSPLTYGLSVPEWYSNLMFWFPSWR